MTEKTLEEKFEVGDIINQGDYLYEIIEEHKTHYIANDYDGQGAYNLVILPKDKWLGNEVVIGYSKDKYEAKIKEQQVKIDELESVRASVMKEVMEIPIVLDLNAQIKELEEFAFVLNGLKEDAQEITAKTIIEYQKLKADNKRLNRVYEVCQKERKEWKQKACELEKEVQHLNSVIKTQNIILKEKQDD